MLLTMSPPTPAISIVAIFCAPVLGIWEAVGIAIIALVLFGVPLLAILRRVRRENERAESARRRAKLTSAPPQKSDPPKAPPPDVPDA